MNPTRDDYINYAEDLCKAVDVGESENAEDAISTSRDKTR